MPAYQAAQEVVQDSAKEGNIEAETQTNAPLGDWVSPGGLIKTFWDDRIIYFGASLKPGQSEFSTLIRMELPGKVGVPPVPMEGMYTKAVRGLSNLGRIEDRRIASGKKQSRVSL